MDEKFNSPKGFGQILDLTFSLSKNKFRDFFMILLIFMGPIYLLQALIQLIFGVGFFREVGGSGPWYEQVASSFGETEVNMGANLGTGFVGFMSYFLFPVASAAILLAVNHIRKNEEYTIGSVIKQAFSRYWPMLGSTMLFSLFVFGLVFFPILIITLVSVLGAVALPALGIILAIILFLGFAVGIGYLLTRWSFYFGSVVLGEGSPGYTRSWRLTRKRTWALIGLYIVFFLIITSISVAIELTFGLFLGNSVLLSLITSVATIFTTLILSVGYAVMYLDLKIRHDADDLKDMIEDYNVK
ncbi:hypothetical protein [Lederbergia lenta]|uniref:DUF7847 domain-containing protein n=1 Tax=Lederbergia lenta TaxID=1467 RepID=A0A2X4VKE5_LEDLE|nr:hypothetical protein [Lederbergia lenta]MEC2323523.1 hypothetical protein [Lederbergia lenta]SQI52646.1 Uncharacterised protein [Lederbergia lenta]